MTGEPQKASEGGGGILDRITGFFGGKKDKAERPDQAEAQTPELDKTQAALQELEKGVDARAALEGLMDQVRLAFYQDLAEAGVPTATYERYWQKVEGEIQGYVEAARKGQAESSSEFKDLNAFVGDLDKLTALKDPDGIKGLALKLVQSPILAPLTGLLYGVLMDWADEGKQKNKGRDTAAGGLLRRLAAAMAPEEAAQAAMAEVEAKRAQTAGSPAGGPAVAAETRETAGLPAEVLVFLDALHVRIPHDNAQAKANFEALKGKHTPDKIREYAAAAAKPGSAVEKIYGAARGVVGSDKFPALLSDVRFQALATNVVDGQIIQPIADGRNLTPEKIRTFLDAVDVARVDSFETAKTHLT